MARQQQAMGERQKAMDSMSESFNKLYEAWMPKQREVFDKSYGPGIATVSSQSCAPKPRRRIDGRLFERNDMSKIVAFGEHIDGYQVPVLNEREVRAAAGILFVFAMMTFANAWFIGNFRPTKIFVIAFLIDFTIRIFVNPKYSPSMILGRFAVRNQLPEWTGAPQKRFAWAVGWALAVTMLWLIVINNVIGPINMLVCATCLTLMFFESAFGICIGCKIYNAFSSRQAQHCSGAACEVFTPHASQKVGAAGVAIVASFLALIGFVARQGFPASDVVAPVTPVAAPASAAAGGDDRCTPPAFAVAMGHAEKWKLHNNCK